MARGGRVLNGATGSGRFDVICAGEASWKISSPAFASKEASLSLRPGGGAVNTALALARDGLSVGLATALDDDTNGRALFDRIAAAGVDVEGVTLVPPKTGLVFVEGAAADGAEMIPFREDEKPVTIPAGWSSRVLLLSGLSPIVSHAAALCKAARAARRAGAIVMMDVNARRHTWKGRDSRAIKPLLREADVVRCSPNDLAALGWDPSILRDALRMNAVLVSNSATGNAWAIGPFGEVAKPSRKTTLLRAQGSGDAFAAAICAELAKAGEPGEWRPELWSRALDKAVTATASPSR